MRGDPSLNGGLNKFYNKVAAFCVIIIAGDIPAISGVTDAAMRRNPGNRVYVSHTSDAI